MKTRLYKGEDPHKIKKSYSGTFVYFSIMAHKKYDAEIEKALLEDCRIFEMEE